jgi:hypothetical protein
VTGCALPGLVVGTRTKNSNRNVGIRYNTHTFPAEEKLVLRKLYHPVGDAVKANVNDALDALAVIEQLLYM